MAATLVDAEQAAGEFLRFQLRIGYLDRKQLVDCVADCLDDELGDAAAAGERCRLLLRPHASGAPPLHLQLIDGALPPGPTREYLTPWAPPSAFPEDAVEGGERHGAG